MQTARVHITALNSAGAGVGRLASGKVIFIPFALPGEMVEAVLRVEKKNWAQGELRRTLTHSPQRREPVCPHFYSCGGCALQHLEDEEQLSWKQNTVQENLRRLGHLQDTPVLPILESPAPLHYRNKITLQWEQRGETVVLGFYKPGTRDLVEIQSCYLAATPLNEALAGLPDLLHGLPLPARKQKSKKQVTLRYSWAQDEIMLVFSLPEGVGQALLQCLPALQERIPRLASAWYLAGNRTVHLAGKTRLRENLLGYTFSLGPRSFFQVNPRQAAKLFQEVRSRLPQETPLTGLVDLHCGTGVMTLLAAERSTKIFGVDTCGSAIADARENARVNQVPGAMFYQGTAEELLPRLLKKAPIKAALLNPPRQGCSERLLHTMAEAAIPSLIYVSCNPATLSRDLQRLAARGYTAEAVQPVDMFPQTPHVECVVLMSRVDK